MKLVRYGRPGREKPGLIDNDGKLRDLSDVVDDISPDALSPKFLTKISKIKAGRLPLVRGKPRYGVPVSHVGKIICIGLNYSDQDRKSVV